MKEPPFAGAISDTHIAMEFLVAMGHKRILVWTKWGWEKGLVIMVSGTVCHCQFGCCLCGCCVLRGISEVLVSDKNPTVLELSIGPSHALIHGVSSWHIAHLHLEKEHKYKQAHGGSIDRVAMSPTPDSGQKQWSQGDSGHLWICLLLCIIFSSLHHS